MYIYIYINPEKIFPQSQKNPPFRLVKAAIWEPAIVGLRQRLRGENLSSTRKPRRGKVEIHWEYVLGSSGIYKTTGGTQANLVTCMTSSTFWNIDEMEMWKYNKNYQKVCLKMAFTSFYPKFIAIQHH